MLHDHPSVGPTAIRTQFGAIFVSLELSRSKWVLTSLSPGNGEKMSQYSLTAGDVGGLLARFADLKRKAKERTGSDYPIITIHEAGLDGFWVHRVLQDEGIESHVVECRLDRDVAPAPTGQDGQDRRRGAVASAVGLQAGRAAGVRHGGRAVA